MAFRIGIVKLILGIAGLIVAVQIFTMFHFANLHSNEMNMKFRKSIEDQSLYQDHLGPKQAAQRPVAVYREIPSEKYQVLKNPLLQYVY